MKNKKVKEVSHEWEQLNKNKPLWMRKSKDFTNGCSRIDKGSNNLVFCGILGSNMDGYYEHDRPWRLGTICVSAQHHRLQKRTHRTIAKEIA